jgi:hypothetical protein
MTRARILGGDVVSGEAKRVAPAQAELLPAPGWDVVNDGFDAPQLPSMETTNAFLTPAALSA